MSDKMQNEGTKQKYCYFLCGVDITIRNNDFRGAYNTAYCYKHTIILQDGCKM